MVDPSKSCAKRESANQPASYTFLVGECVIFGTAEITWLRRGWVKRRLQEVHAAEETLERGDRSVAENYLEAFCYRPRFGMMALASSRAFSSGIGWFD
jgi:hypothetical protein